VGCWHGYLSGARCRLAYGPADASATHCLLLSKIQIGFTFLVPADRDVQCNGGFHVTMANGYVQLCGIVCVRTVDVCNICSISLLYLPTAIRTGVSRSLSNTFTSAFLASRVCVYVTLLTYEYLLAFSALTLLVG